MDTSFSLAGQLLLVAGDHLSALERLLNDPALAVSPWTVARSVVESVSICLWLMDPGIGAPERIARGMNLRLQSLNDSVTWFGSLDQPDDVRQQIERQKERLRGLKDLAVSRGVTPVLNRQGVSVGFGERMPSISTLTGHANLEEFWRLASGMAHGRNWATLSGGFSRVDGTNVVTPTLSPEGTPVLVSVPLWAWLRGQVAMFTYAGWKTKDLAAVCDPLLDAAGFTRGFRPWA